MKKGTKIFLAVVGVVVFVALGFYLWTAIKAKREATKAAEGAGNASGSTGTAAGNSATKPKPQATGTVTPAYIALPEGDFPLKKGSKSRLVWLLQLYLNERHSAGIAIDGSFGPATELACQKNLGVVQISKAKAEELIKSVPPSRAFLFVEYADLIGRKISGTLGATVKNW